MSALLDVSIQQRHKVLLLARLILAECIRHDGKRVGDTILGIHKRHFRYRRERCYRTVCVASVHRVCARCKGNALLSAIRCRTCVLAVGYVGCDREDRCRRDSAAVGVVALDIADECVKHFLCNVVNAVVIISVFREVALHLEVYSDSVLIADRLYLCVLDGRQGIRHNRKTSDSGREPAAHLLVMKRHLQLLVTVFVMHIMNDV